MEIVAEFIKALKEDENLREEVQRTILTEELLNLPTEFRAFVQKQEAFNDHVREFIHRQAGINSQQEAFNDHVRGFIHRQEAFNERQEAFNNEIREYHRNWEHKYNRDVEYMKSFTSTAGTKEELPLLARMMGLKYKRSLSREEIVDLSLSIAQGAPLSGDLHSFARADIIFIADRDGEEVYVTVEVSFTADSRDTSRAIRNAGFLTQATGLTAMPVIASVNIDHRILDEIQAGKVRHYDLTDKTDKPE